ncbi:MAG: hypothetical protein PS018_01065 [bacterium]|nr:hypothetical protein [bacterium]
MPNEQLDIATLEDVSGGMKWERGHKSAYVIDARGGSLTFLGTTITLDQAGHVSSITYRS